MFESILVPVDGSEPSDRAVVLSVKVAKTSGAQLRFVNVVNSDAVILDSAEISFVDPQRTVDELKKSGEEILAKAAAAAGASGVTAATEQADGDPVTRIVEVAGERGCDLIVMGTHGRTGLVRMLLGSVTEGVLHHSHVPVLCVREEPQAQAEAGADA